MLTRDDVACWLLKTARSPDEIGPGWPAGAPRTLDRCLRRSYRLELMEPGQRCLLWLSGRAEPGVHAVGTLAETLGPVRPARGPRCELRRLAEPVPRDELLASALPPPPR